MKTPVPAPYRLAELRERVIASLGAWTMSTVVPSSSLSLEVWMIRSIIPWEYYVRAEPVPEGLTREARWCAVRSSGRPQEKRSGSSPSRPR